MSDLVAVIMAGGQGQRFWPLSTADRPKQFLDLEQRGRTLIQATYDRLVPLVDGPGKVLVATGTKYRDLVHQQLPEVPLDNIIVEPVGRDSAPAITLASLTIAQKFGRKTIAGFFSSDHSISPIEKFCTTVASAADMAQEFHSLVIVGIRPNRAATSYGYIELGESIGDGFRVERFVEKPNIRTAELFLAGGRHLWNAGIFVWEIETVLQELQTHIPEIYNPLNEAVAHGTVTEVFGKLPRTSIDYGLMEKTDQALVVPGTFNWDDIGDWVALERHLRAAGEDTNTVVGHHVGNEASGNIIYTDSPDDTIITLGIHNLVVVKRGNTVFLMPKDRAQDVKNILADKRIEDLKLD